MTTEVPFGGGSGSSFTAQDLSSDSTIAPYDLARVDTGSTNTQITTPADGDSSDGDRIIVSKVDLGAGNVNIVANSGQTLRGPSTLKNQGEALQYAYDGGASTWRQINGSTLQRFVDHGTDTVSADVGTSSSPVSNVHSQTHTTDELSTADHFVGANFKSLSTALSDAAVGEHIRIVEDGYSLSQSHDITTAGLTLSTVGEIDAVSNQISINADDVTLRDFSLTDTDSGAATSIPVVASNNSAVDNLTLHNVSIRGQTNVNKCFDSGGSTNQLTNVVFRDCDFSGSNNQDLVAFNNTNNILIDGGTYDDAGDACILFFDGTDNITVRNAKFTDWMQRNNNPDGAVEVYNGDGHTNVRIENNRIIPDSTAQSKTYQCLGVNAVKDEGAIVEGNYIKANTTDIGDVIGISPNNADTVDPDTIILRDNIIDITADVGNAVFCEGARVLRSTGNRIVADGVTFGDAPVRCVDVDNYYAIGDYLSQSSTVYAKFKHAATMNNHVIAFCSFPDLGNRMNSPISGTIKHAARIGNYVNVTATNPCLRVGDEYSYYTATLNYLETDDTTAISNTGNASVSSEIVANNHTNTA